MDAGWAVERPLTPEAVEFVRFCYDRRRLGWPELYDEMCAVASRGLFQGWGPDDLARHGIGFGLFELPALAAVVARVVAEEQALGRGCDRRGSRSATRLAAEGVRPDADAERQPTSLADERRARETGADEDAAAPTLPMLVPMAS